MLPEMKLKTKRVATLYRVSTKGQLDGSDIPLQRRACEEFIDRQGWKLVKEYIEKGISGYKISATKRDELQRARAGAEAKEYDILLVFMFDRLGRRDDETPFVLKWFAQQGIEVWSVKEGQQKFEDHSDDLVNYIRFWQSSGESKKTSLRVDEKHTQMAREGVFRGGTPPFGYKLVQAGIQNKKGKELLKLAIDEEQAPIVKLIYNFVYEKGYGSNRIAKALNAKGIKTGTGSGWVTGAINYILRNPIYKGYLTYGKRKSNIGIFATRPREQWILAEEPNPDLIIIEETIWDKVQDIRSSRSPGKVKNHEIQRYNVSTSPLLFVGLIYCGHCGSPLTTTYNSKSYTNKAGIKKKYKSTKYRCSGKALGKPCDGQTIYAQKKVESIVLEEIDHYLDQLKQLDITKIVHEQLSVTLNEDRELLRSLSKKRKAATAELNTLHAEVAKSLTGKSAFKPDLLNDLIVQKQSELDALGEQITQIEGKVSGEENKVAEYELMKKHVPVWKKVFRSADYDKKKMMAHSIIDKVVVWRERVEVSMLVNLGQFSGSDIIQSKYLS